MEHDKSQNKIETIVNILDQPPQKVEFEADDYSQRNHQFGASNPKVGAVSNVKEGLKIV